MLFTKVSHPYSVPDQGKSKAYLVYDNWDDFGFKTSYKLIVFDGEGNKNEIGYLKIGHFKQEGGPTKIPDNFNSLGEEYFSLGQDADFYTKIHNLGYYTEKELLVGLKDIVHDEELLNKALNEEVTETSLLRSISLSSVKGQFKRILTGHALLTEYHFKYEIPQNKRVAGFSVKFHVYPESNPPTNIHVLIGRNGVGKTHLLNDMVNSIVDQDNRSESVGKFVNDDGLMHSQQDALELFAGVVSVAFSAFDPFEPIPEKKEKKQGIRYSYVGLKRSTNYGGEQGTPMSHDMQTKEFVKSMMSCFAHGKVDRWKKSLETLESDPLFQEAGMSELTSLTGDSELEKEAKSIFNKMSSGHRIVLLIITKLVEKVEEKTLVLMDEPEGHLHPPLLSAFIRALSDLLSNRNGVAIIATHSPVVVQEVPKKCVWKLRRSGLCAEAERPVIETFGENVSVLTREIFGLEVTDSGYHQLLRNAISRGSSYDNVLSDFEMQLGSEARGILRGLIAEQERNG